MSEKFVLEYKEHHNVFFRIAEKFCKSETLCDVVLTCGNLHFSSHKLVLAACSGYFAKLFTETPFQGLTGPVMLSPQTVVHLKDINPTYMQLLIDYMYRGEITCSEKDLQGVLDAARELQIRGLSDHGIAEPGEPKSSKKKRKSLNDNFFRSKKISKSNNVSKDATQSNDENDGEDDENEENKKPKMKVAASSVKNEETDDEDTEHDGTIETYGGDENEEIEFEYEDPVGEEENLLNPNQCPECMKVFRSKDSTRRHYKSVHAKETPFACWECKYATSRRSTLANHMVRSHNIDKDEFYRKAKEMFQVVKINNKREWVQVQNA